MSTLVRPGLGPSGPDLLRRLPRAVRAALAVGALALAGLVVWWATLGATAGETWVVVEDPFTFNLTYGDEFERVQGDGALDLERVREDGLFVSSFAVRDLTLPPYEGNAAGVLPLLATFHVRELRERFEGFELVEEGRTRVNFVPGYEVVFQYDLGERTVYGRDVFLVPEVPGLRAGAQLELRATPTSGTPNAESIGDVGAIRLPFRSFRLGTERMTEPPE
ncbi:MAG: hypothetical protein MSC31_13280 [Solirubrobacteraceae bacterium MAG38_C4-C5]|nr:hypothetical protein [Candidatus Siliceabacter maunaloa]